MTTIYRDFLPEITEVLDIITEFDKKEKTLEYKIKCRTVDNELKMVRFLTHGDRILTSNKVSKEYRMVLFNPIYKPLLDLNVAYIVEDYIEKMTLDQIEKALGYKVEIIE